MLDSVRHAVPDDASELARLRWVMLSTPSVPWTDSREIPGGEWVNECEEAFAHMIGRDDFAAFVIDAAPGQLAACAAGFILPRFPGPGSSAPHNGDVSTVCTDSDYRGRGYGRAVVTALMYWLNEQGCNRISLTASPEGEPLYVSLGFSRDETLRMTWRAGR